MRKQLELIMPIIFIVLAVLTGYGQNVGDEFSFDGIKYRITSKNPNSVEVMGLSGGIRTSWSPNLTILKNIFFKNQIYDVTAIGEDAFNRRDQVSLEVSTDKLTEITFESPSNVTVIGASAFAYNRLTEVTLPESVISIDRYAFYDNRLTGVTIPNSVTSIGRYAFAYNRLARVTISKNVTSFGMYAFWDNDLTKIIIPASVTYTGNSTFANNPNLATVEVKPTDPPTLHTATFLDLNGTDLRNQINLIVPLGRIQAYLDNGWTGFKSISDGSRLAIGGLKKDSFIIYPNPAMDKGGAINLGLGQELKQVNIYSIDTIVGTYLHSENRLEINIDRLSKGMYLFEIVTKTDRSIEKIVIADR